MQLPFFYTSHLPVNNLLTLNENNSRHAIQVLRMRIADELNITDGQGKIYHAQITTDNKKSCVVQINSITEIKASTKQITIAISLLKNTSRFEWFLEKITEMGVTQIIPLLCNRTEKQQFKTERLQGILQSAMLQSQQAWLPVMLAPQGFVQVIINNTSTQKLIAHCQADEAKTALTQICFKNPPINNTIILIGPEGDFTPQEIELAQQNRYLPVSLGNTRLRTETAGILSAALLTNSF